MLKPGEVRTAPAAANPEHTVTAEYVAGGSFVQVKVTDAEGKWLYNRSHQFSSSALAEYDRLTNGPVDEMEA